MDLTQVCTREVSWEARCCATQVEHLQLQARHLKSDKEDLLRDVGRLKDTVETMRANGEACLGTFCT